MSRQPGNTPGQDHPMWGRVCAEGLNISWQKYRCSRTYPQREQLWCLVGALRANKRNDLGCWHLTSPPGMQVKVTDCQVIHLATSWPSQCCCCAPRSTWLLMGLRTLAACSHLRFIRLLSTSWCYQQVFAHPRLATMSPQSQGTFGATLCPVQTTGRRGGLAGCEYKRW